MKYFAKNIAFLREKKGLKQAQMPASIGIARTTWNNYEGGNSNPTLEGIIKIAQFFDISETDLLHTDLEHSGNLNTKKGDAENLQKRKLIGKGKGNLTDKSSGKATLETERSLTHRMPQVITIDSAGNENVVLVPVRARAGYLNGYADPVFMSKLPTYRLPGLNNGTFRLFECEGLSMYPTLHGGDLIIGSFIEHLQDIRDDRVYVVVTKNDGVVVKRIINRLQKDGKLILKSDNYKDRDMYPPMVCDPGDILEIWYATGFISRQLRPPAEMYTRVVDLEARLTLMEESFRKMA